MNRSDDDRNARPQVTLRLDQDLLRQIDELAAEERIDRTELARRLLADGLANRRAATALAEYAGGRRSAWSAASRAGVDLYEMLDRIAEAGIPYRVDPETIRRLRSRPDPDPDTEEGGGPSRPSASSSGGDQAVIDELRVRYRPATVRLLLVGESSPAGGTHFYFANSILYRAVRDAVGRGLAVARPPEGAAFLEWFQGLGCWLVDLADAPVDQLPARERAERVKAGVPALARLMAEVRPDRVLVVIRRVAPAVRRAATRAGLDERAIDVLPFPIRQWRPVFVDQLAGVIRQELASGTSAVPESAAGRAGAQRAVAESAGGYGTPILHEVMAAVLRQNDNAWLKATRIAAEIERSDLWRRPSDGGHPPASQISARARRYPDLFQVSDLGIRLRQP